MMKYKIKVSTKYLNSLCKWLDEWSLKEDSLCIPQFLAQHGIAWKYLSALLKEYQQVEECLDIVASRLHSRWLKIAIETPNISKTLGSLLNRYMRYYDRHTLEIEREFKSPLPDVSQMTINIPYTSESYKNLPLSGDFKKMYEKNDNK